ncbi:MAG: hypothetical protein F6K42_19915, partial [Leptolyngbya sp. SIO1D8]|nr:hypothetical protein [Leptolyngbya sp. SIO1D8]
MSLNLRALSSSDSLDILPMHFRTLLGYQNASMVKNVIGHFVYAIISQSWTHHWLDQWKKPSNHHNDTGQPSSSRQNFSNVEYDFPEGSPIYSIVLVQYDAAVENLQAYTQRELELLPAWMEAWPQLLVKRYTYFYCEMMGNRDHILMLLELKHLMARVSAIFKNHTHLTAVEGV